MGFLVASDLLVELLLSLITKGVELLALRIKRRDVTGKRVEFVCERCFFALLRLSVGDSIFKKALIFMGDECPDKEGDSC